MKMNQVMLGQMWCQTAHAICLSRYPAAGDQTSDISDWPCSLNHRMIHVQDLRPVGITVASHWQRWCPWTLQNVRQCWQHLHERKLSPAAEIALDHWGCCAVVFGVTFSSVGTKCFTWGSHPIVVKFLWHFVGNTGLHGDKLQTHQRVSLLIHCAPWPPSCDSLFRHWCLTKEFWDSALEEGQANSELGKITLIILGRLPSSASGRELWWTMKSFQGRMFRENVCWNLELHVRKKNILIIQLVDINIAVSKSHTRCACPAEWGGSVWWLTVWVGYLQDSVGYCRPDLSKTFLFPLKCLFHQRVSKRPTTAIISGKKNWKILNYKRDMAKDDASHKCPWIQLWHGQKIPLRSVWAFEYSDNHGQQADCQCRLCEVGRSNCKVYPMYL